MHQSFFALGFAQFTLSNEGTQGTQGTQGPEGPEGPVDLKPAQLLSLLQGPEGPEGPQGPVGLPGRDASLLSFWGIITNWRYIAVSGITYTGMTVLFIKCVMG